MLRRRFIRLGFAEAWKAIAAADSLQSTFERLEKELKSLARRQGELALTIPMACFEAVRAALERIAGPDGTSGSTRGSRCNPSISSATI